MSPTWFLLPTVTRDGVTHVCIESALAGWESGE